MMKEIIMTQAKVEWIARTVKLTLQGRKGRIYGKRLELLLSLEILNSRQM